MARGPKALQGVVADPGVPDYVPSVDARARRRQTGREERGQGDGVVPRGEVRQPPRLVDAIKRQGLAAVQCQWLTRRRLTRAEAWVTPLGAGRQVGTELRGGGGKPGP